MTGAFTPVDHAQVLFAALVLDALIGDPGAVWRRIPHPVVLMGRMVDRFERAWNRSALAEGKRRVLGTLAILILVAAAGGAGWALAAAAASLPGGALVEVACVAVLLAQKDLYRHVAEVARALETDGLEAARGAVAHIVGRTPASLDEAAVSRAAVESLAENFSDAVVAPVFWYLVLGLPGIVACKMINTADSMIGHRSDRFRAFGGTAARLDDIANLVPARLAATLLSLAAPAVARASWRSGIRAAWRDAARHRSVNAGWPEAAMAGALGFRLAGPRCYDGVSVDDAWMGDGRGELGAPDIRRALALYTVACALLAAGVLVLAVVSIA